MLDTVGAVGRLIGRDSECTRLAAELVSGALVTLTGPGGVGKTRLAREVVDDAPFAELGALPPGAGPHELAQALGFESVAAAAVVLAERPATVVFDGCEQVLGPVRDVVSVLRRAAPELVVVCTSRHPLGERDEVVMVVEPLGLPALGGADLQLAPAVELFLELAHAAGAPAFDGRDLAHVAELCRRLDGLPLAIELAAARTRAIEPVELLAQIDARMELLPRTLDVDRGGTSMQAAIDVSTSLLPATERTFFRRLGVFSGPFDLRLAHAVAGGPGVDRVASIDVVAALVDRSLIAAEQVGPVTRYRLLELLRDHARRQLADSGELAGVEERFVDAMLTVADEVVGVALSKWDATLLASASGQFANLVRACELCIERDPGPHRAFRLLLPMYAALHEGRPEDVWSIGQRVLDRWPEQPAPWRTEALAVLASAAAIAGRDEDVAPLAMAVVDDPVVSVAAAAIADRAWGLALRATDPAAAARHFWLATEAAVGMGAASLASELRIFEAGERDLAGDPDRALDLLAAVIARADAADDAFVLVLAHLVRSRVLLRSGAVEAATIEVDVAAARCAAIHQSWWMPALARTAAAVTAVASGWSASTGQWRAALDDAVRIGAVGEIAIVLRAAAATARHLGELVTATALWHCAPRSTAITVLPELFPEAVAELTAAAPAGSPGQDLVAALATARRTLAAPAESPPAAEPRQEVLARPDGVRTGELVREGDGWRLAFAGKVTRVRDMKGIADLAVLVTRPGREVHALELMGAHDVGGEAGPALDAQAKRTYQERIVELQRDIDQARADHDERRAERAELELDALVEQLSEAFGLGGRARATGSSAERARSAVTARIRASIRKVGELHPELGRHLGNAVRTGTWCAYRPETDVHWTVTTS